MLLKDQPPNQREVLLPEDFPGVLSVEVNLYMFQQKKKKRRRKNLTGYLTSVSFGFLLADIN